jgi:hypothetical protein
MRQLLAKLFALVCTVVFTLVPLAAWASSTWYVGNSTAGAWTAGNDSTGTGADRSHAYLTLNKALLVASSGDTIVLEPNGTISALTGTEYLEVNSGSYVTVTQNSLTIEADPSLSGYAWVSYNYSSPSRVLQVNSGLTGTVTFSGLVIDGSGNAGSVGTANVYGVRCSTNDANVVCTNCGFTNFTTGVWAFSASSGTGDLASFTNCSFSSSVVNGVNVGSVTVSVTATGCFFNCSGKAVDGTNGAVTGSVTVSGCTFNNATQMCLYVNGVGGTANSVKVTGNTIVEAARGLYFALATSTLAHIWFNSNSVSDAGSDFAAYPFTLPSGYTCADVECNGNTCSTTYGLADIVDELATVQVENNVVTLPASLASVSATNCADGIDVVLCAAGLLYSNNVVTDNSVTALIHHDMQVGPDGPLQSESNSGGTLSGVKWMDTSNDALIDVSFVTSAVSAGSHSSSFDGFNLELESVGSPAGTLLWTLQSDSAGLPSGTVLATFNNTLAASALSGSYATYGFALSAPVTLAASTKYHLVGADSGSVSSSNYVQVYTNTTATGVGANTGVGVVGQSPASPSWTMSSTQYAVMSGLHVAGLATGAAVSGNVCVVNASASTSTHGLIVACVPNPSVSTNRVVGGEYQLVAKDLWSGGTFSDNLVANGLAGAGGLAYKGNGVAGWTGVNWYQNTVVEFNNTTASPVETLVDNSVLSFGSNATAPTTGKFENNVLARSASSTAGKVYNFASGTAVTTANNNLFLGSNTTADGTNSFSAWQALGNDAKSVNADPLLSNESPTTAAVADFVPSAAGGAVGVGVNLFASTPSDFNGSYFASCPTAGAFSLARQGSELMCRQASATLVYGVVRNIVNQVYNFQTGAFENYSAANVGYYAAYMVQQGSSGVWSGPLPALPKGTFTVDYRYGSGAPSQGDSLVADPCGVSQVWWSGTAAVDPAVLQLNVLAAVGRIR